MQKDDAVDQFCELAKSWRSGFSKSMRILFAVRSKGRWELVFSKFVLFADLFDESGSIHTPETVETGSLLAVREIVDFDEVTFHQMLDSLESQPFYVYHENYQIELCDEAEERASFYFDPFGNRDQSSQWCWPTLDVSTSASSTGRNVPNSQQLELELLGHRHPYASLAELLTTFDVPTDILQMGYSRPRTVWMLTQPATIMQESKISDEVAHIAVKCPTKLPPSDFSIGLRVFSHNNPIQRIEIRSSEFRWNVRNGWAIGNVEYPLNQPSIADIHLNFKKRYLGHYWISDPNRSLNPLADVHNLFDIKSVVGPGFFDLKADFFEDGVAVLLGLLGLRVLHYGGIPQLQQAPDLLAQSDNGDLFVIECTTRDVGRSGKLLKLSQRTKEIVEANNQRSLGYQNIQAIMFTTLAREETKACWEEASEFGIALVCREDIQGLIERVSTPPNAKEIFAAAKQAIPSKNPQAQLPFNT